MAGSGRQLCPRRHHHRPDRLDHPGQPLELPENQLKRQPPPAAVFVWRCYDPARQNREAHMQHLTRRHLVAATGGLALTGLARPVLAGEGEPHFDLTKPTKDVAIPEAKVAEVAAAPLIQKTVRKLWNDSSLGMTQPNAMQFTPRGTLLL